MFVPGNKDWSLCPDPAQALEHFNDQMGAEYVAQHWGVPTGYNIIRQKGRPENFAFLHRRVMYAGVNMVRGPQSESRAEWSQRVADNLAWISENVENNLANVDALVMFGHSAVNEDGPPNNEFFWVNAVAYLQMWDMPMIYIEPTAESDWGLIRGAEGIRNFSRLKVKADTWPPMKVVLDTKVDGFMFDQDDWFQDRLEQVG